MSKRKMTIRLLAGEIIRLRFDRANARHLESAMRFRDALLITVAGEITQLLPPLYRGI